MLIFERVFERMFEQRKTFFTLLTILCLNGIYAYFTIPSQENPTVLVREATIVTPIVGMSAVQVERMITQPIEESLLEVSEIKLIRSTSTTGLSVIHVELHDKYFQLAVIWQRIKDKVAQAHKILPRGTPLSVVNDEFGDVSVMTLAITAPDIPQEILRENVKSIRDNLSAIQGVKKISIVGLQKEHIYLEMKSELMARYHISPSVLFSQLKNRNIISNVGSVDNGLASYLVKISGSIVNSEELEQLLITVPDSAVKLPLSTFVDVKRQLNDPKVRAAYFNNEPAVMISIVMEEGVNIRQFSPKLHQAVLALSSRIAQGIHIEFASEQLDQVNTILDTVTLNIVQSLAIVLTVSILFLGMRTGLVVGISVPCVMLITFAVMFWFNIVIERLSLATLVIALGLLVDNSIVIAEDFKQKLLSGLTRWQAMIKSISELAIPLLSSTGTTILFFLPLILADHVASEFTRSISLVITISLSISWLLAISFVPLMCYYFIASPKDKSIASTSSFLDSDVFFTWLNKLYRQLLLKMLSHRIKVMVFVLITLVAAIALKTLITKQFFPESDRPQILLYMDLANGSSIRKTDAQLKKMLTLLSDAKRFPQIVKYRGYAGHNGDRFVTTLNPEDPKPNRAFIVIDVDDMSKMDELIRKLYLLVDLEFPLVTARIKRMFIGTSDSNVLRVQFKGSDKEHIYQQASQFTESMQSRPNMLDVSMDWGNKVLQLDVQVNNLLANKLEITHQDINQALSTNFNGLVIDQYRESDQLIPIILIGKDKLRFNIDQLKSILVYSEKMGVSFPLEQIAEVNYVNQFSVIERENMFPTVSVDLRHQWLTAQELKDKIDSQVQKISTNQPLNHWVEYDAVVEDTKSARKALAANMPMALILVILILISQTKSYRKVLLILLTIPLMCIGAIPGLYLMSGKFGFMVTLGFYSLAGIIINNAIVLVDKIDRELVKNKDNADAIINACMARVRPILMTSLTTSLGLLPLILYKDPMFYSLAVLLSFGLLIGTLFIIFFVPICYSLLMKSTTKE